MHALLTPPPPLLVPCWLGGILQSSRGGRHSAAISGERRELGKGLKEATAQGGLDSRRLSRWLALIPELLVHVCSSACENY